MPAPPPRPLPSGTPPCHSTIGTPSDAYFVRSASRWSRQSRYASCSSSVSPSGTNEYGESSISARSKPRARRSKSAPTARSSSKRAEREHERSRRQRPRRDHVEVLPRVAEQDLGVEQRVDDPVELRRPGGHRQPVQDAAERDEPDTVLLAQVERRERRSRSDADVERPQVGPPRLGEGVEKDDDVGVPLRMRLVHPRLTAPRRGPPVHAPHAVAVRERAQIRELDPFAADRAQPGCRRTPASRAVAAGAGASRRAGRP